MELVAPNEKERIRRGRSTDFDRLASRTRALLTESNSTPVSPTSDTASLITTSTITASSSADSLPVTTSDSEHIGNGGYGGEHIGNDGSLAQVRTGAMSNSTRDGISTYRQFNINSKRSDPYVPSTAEINNNSHQSCASLSASDNRHLASNASIRYTPTTKNLVRIPTIVDDDIQVIETSGVQAMKDPLPPFMTPPLLRARLALSPNALPQQQAAIDYTARQAAYASAAAYLFDGGSRRLTSQGLTQRFRSALGPHVVNDTTDANLISSAAIVSAAVAAFESTNYSVQTVNEQNSSSSLDHNERDNAELIQEFIQNRRLSVQNSQQKLNETTASGLPLVVAQVAKATAMRALHPMALVGGETTHQVEAFAVESVLADTSSTTSSKESLNSDLTTVSKDDTTDSRNNTMSAKRSASDNESVDEMWFSDWNLKSQDEKVIESIV